MKENPESSPSVKHNDVDVIINKIIYYWALKQNNMYQRYKVDYYYNNTPFYTRYCFYQKMMN